MWPSCGGRVYWAPARPSPAEARGVVVVFAWVWSDDAQLRPFVELYSSLGWLCLVCRADLVLLYLSEKAASLASGVISELVKLLDRKCGDETMKDYRLVRNCICGQVYDSGPVDFVTDVGTQFLQNPVIGNSSQASMLLSWMAKALASGMDTLFPSRIEAQRAEYWHTHYSSAWLGPVLIFCSEDDDLAPCHVVCGFARRLVEQGTDVQVNKWSDSCHDKSHEAEYRSAVNDILKKALVTLCHRSQLNGASATGDQNYKIVHSVCNLHKAAANSNESLRRVANSPSDHFLPSSKDHNESREPDSLIEEQRRQLSHPPSMEPQGVLVQILLDVCVSKNVEGWDIKPTVSPNGRSAISIDFCTATWSVQSHQVLPTFKTIVCSSN